MPLQYLKTSKMNNIITFQRHDCIIPNSNQAPFFLNDRTLTDFHIIKSFSKDITCTPFEEKILNTYFLKDRGWGLQRDINFKSELIMQTVDVVRFFNFHN